jgi:hypothetical protein
MRLHATSSCWRAEYRPIAETAIDVWRVRTDVDCTPVKSALASAVFAAMLFTMPAHAQQPQPLPLPNACPQASGGPPPCRDTDGDGFCDSWEHAQRIPGGPLLPDADPKKPDIYVMYDWMGYGSNEQVCSSQQQCSRGETCSADGVCTYTCETDQDCRARFPTDVHAGEQCVANTCLHTHDPVIVDPTALDAVVARFAAHHINLHIVRGHARPHSHLASFLSDDEMQLGCEGGSVAAGTVGPGKYAVSLYDLKPVEASTLAYHYVLFAHDSGCVQCPNRVPQSTCSNRNLVAGQAGYADYSRSDVIVSLGTAVNLNSNAPRSWVASAFMHELGHNLGLHHDGHIDRPCRVQTDCPSDETCAELFDNQGRVCHETTPQGLGAEEPNWKPNYLSVMNYRYQKGIPIAATIGSRIEKPCDADSDCGGDGGRCIRRRVEGHCAFSWRQCVANADCGTSGESCVVSAPVKTCSLSGYACDSDSDCNDGESCATPVMAGTCVRLDFSRQTLPRAGATPGVLDERHLDDAAGLGSGTTDIFNYTDATCHTCPLSAPSTGAVNWMGTGVFTNPLCQLFRVGPESFTDTDVQADIDSFGDCDPAPSDVLHGHTDWPDLSGIPFNYKFQCVEGLFDRTRTHAVP